MVHWLEKERGRRLMSWVGDKRLRSAAAIVGGAILFLAATVLHHLPHGPEHWSADLRTAKLSPRNASQHPRIALVYVNEATLADHPYLAPVDRALLAELVRTIDAAGPKAIGMDFIFNRPTEPEKDAALVAALKGVKAKLVLGAISGEGPHGAKDESFQARFLASTGRIFGHLYFGEHHNPLIISDSVIREVTDPQPGFPAQRGLAELLAEAMSEGGAPPLRSKYISWLRPPADGTQTFLTLSAKDVLGKNGIRLPVAQMLAGRAVIIAGNFFDRDQHLTPLSVSDGRRYPGAFIHAQILAQILDGRSLRTLSWPVFTLLLSAAAFAGYFVGGRSGRSHMAIEVVSLIGLMVAGVLAFTYASTILPYTGLILAWLAGVAGGHFVRAEHSPATKMEEASS